ncbi:MAG: hypothetical protein FJW64_03600 [Actinobacteria bacterium]|nr:hypothetical protein [Actinomycetota bacterium]
MQHLAGGGGDEARAVAADAEPRPVGWGSLCEKARFSRPLVALWLPWGSAITRVDAPVSSCTTTAGSRISKAVTAPPDAELTLRVPEAAAAPLRTRIVVRYRPSLSVTPDGWPISPWLRRTAARGVSRRCRSPAAPGRR